MDRLSPAKLHMSKAMGFLLCLGAEGTCWAGGQLHPRTMNGIEAHDTRDAILVAFTVAAAEASPDHAMDSPQLRCSGPKP